MHVSHLIHLKSNLSAQHSQQLFCFLPLVQYAETRFHPCAVLCPCQGRHQLAQHRAGRIQIPCSKGHRGLSSPVLPSAYPVPALGAPGAPGFFVGTRRSGTRVSADSSSSIGSLRARAWLRRFTTSLPFIHTSGLWVDLAQTESEPGDPEVTERFPPAICTREPSHLL